MTVQQPIKLVQVVKIRYIVNQIRRKQGNISVYIVQEPRNFAVLQDWLKHWIITDAITQRKSGAYSADRHGTPPPGDSFPSPLYLHTSPTVYSLGYGHGGYYSPLIRVCFVKERDSAGL